MYYFAIKTSIIDNASGSTINTGATVRANPGSAPGVSFGGTTLTLGGMTNTSSSVNNYYFRADMASGYTFNKFELYCSELSSSYRTQTFTGNPTGRWDLSSVVSKHTGSSNRLNLEVRLYVTRATYTITYNSDGGSPTPTAKTVAQGSSTTLASAPTKSGYTFGGWSINGKTYAAGASYTPTGNVTATATWVGNGCVITFEADGTPVAIISGKTGETIGSGGTYAWPTFTILPGYTFGGWTISGVTYKTSQKYVISGSVKATAVLTGGVSGTYDLTDQVITGYESGLYSLNLTVVINQKGVVTNFPDHLAIISSSSQLKASIPGLYFNTGISYSSVNYGFSSGLKNNFTGTADGVDLSVTGERSEHAGTIGIFASGFSGKRTFTIAPPKGWQPYGWLKGSGYDHTHNSTSFVKGKSITLDVHGRMISADYPYQGLVPILIKEHTVTFDANGGTGAPDPVAVLHGEYWTCPTKLPTKPGYTCKGWSVTKVAAWPWDVDEETSESWYVAGRSNYGPLLNDLKLYAVWVPNRGTLAFNACGGKVTPEYRSVHVGDAYGELPTPTLQDAGFLGWFTDAIAGDKVTAETTMNESGLAIIYAHWDKSAYPDTSVYTIRYVDPTGTNPEASREMKVGVSARLAWFSSGLNWSQPSGYTTPTPLWSTSPYSDPIYANGEEVLDLAGPGETITLYINWPRRALTVTFDANGGEPAIKTKTVEHGDKLGKTTEPTKEGFVFDGWYTSKTGGTKYTSKSVVTSSITLYAHWSTAPVFDWWG